MKFGYQWYIPHENQMRIGNFCCKPSGRWIVQKAHSTRRRNILKSAADLQKFVAKPRCHIGIHKWKKVPFWLLTSLVSKVAIPRGDEIIINKGGIPCGNKVRQIVNDILSNKKVRQYKILNMSIPNHCRG